MQCYPVLLCVCAVFSYVQTMVRLPVFGIFNVRTYVMLVHATERGDCTNTVRESALKFGERKKKPFSHRKIEHGAVVKLAAFPSDVLSTLFRPMGFPEANHNESQPHSGPATPSKACRRAVAFFTSPVWDLQVRPH